MSHERADLLADVAAVAAIDAVPTILNVVCRSTGMGFAAIARVTEDHWVACSVHDEINFGLQPGAELKVESTICHEIRQSGEPVFIDNVSLDPVFCKHATPAMYGFQSYVSVPIVRKDGMFFGTLCAIDPNPRSVNTPHTAGLFRLLAELIAFHLESQDRVAETEATLLAQQEMSEMREQFIAVLGHDLRNPLAAITVGANCLSRRPLDEKSKKIVGLIEGSARRMGELIEHAVDFARVRFGGGMSTAPEMAALAPVLEQVVAEARATWPGRQIDAAVAAMPPVQCDGARVAQLFSNLLANAVTHGAAEAPIAVAAGVHGEAFELSVANAGTPIPPAVAERLFQPFFRASVSPSARGLGLGLYIATAIAHAHAGTLSVVSTEAETRFTFRMPSRMAGAT